MLRPESDERVQKGGKDAPVRARLPLRIWRLVLFRSEDRRPAWTRRAFRHDWVTPALRANSFPRWHRLAPVLLLVVILLLVHVLVIHHILILVFRCHRSEGKNAGGSSRCEHRSIRGWSGGAISSTAVSSNRSSSGSGGGGRSGCCCCRSDCSDGACSRDSSGWAVRACPLALHAPRPCSRRPHRRFLRPHLDRSNDPTLHNSSPFHVRLGAARRKEGCLRCTQHLRAGILPTPLGEAAFVGAS
mmetsp:Transcript_7333/g.24339  ORF Transcript_7333/g.24339 Transcript_7333/m.24339 type:complete len:244 (-) Transcript_7333:652-1383(-)